VHRALAERLGRSLERSGRITRDIEGAYLAFEPSEEVPINGLSSSNGNIQGPERRATGPARRRRCPSGIYRADGTTTISGQASQSVSTAPAGRRPCT